MPLLFSMAPCGPRDSRAVGGNLTPNFIPNIQAPGLLFGLLPPPLTTFLESLTLPVCQNGKLYHFCQQYFPISIFRDSATSFLTRNPRHEQARNSEKAQSMLFRFRAQQAADMGIIDLGRTRRPKAITTVDSIPTCERWRGQVLKEISRKVSRIQEPSLSDYQIRDLNDEINKLMREKWAWEMQIRNLGGPNYMRGSGRVYDDEGREIPGGGKGYRYFGRARELPGVKEMFEAAARRGRGPPEEEGAGTGRGGDIATKKVNADYFGYGLDEEDGTLLAHEKQKEKEAIENLRSQGDDDAEDGWEPLPGDAGDGVEWRLPSLEEVQEELVDRRRQRLLQKIS